MGFDPKTSRTVLFVRHGQFQHVPERLTSLGVRQALLTGRELDGLYPNRFYCSTMPRAIETAKIISRQLKMKAQRKECFRESVLPVSQTAFLEMHRSRKEKISKADFKSGMVRGKRRADKGFDFLFKKPRKGQETVLVVAHGNVIRYWVCRALGLDAKKWTSMDIQQCSITGIRINDKGQFMLLSFSDARHLPKKLRTYQ
ncbi:MAG: histidine phosphatase family protein [Bdellovibrionota bacterium]